MKISWSKITSSLSTALLNGERDSPNHQLWIKLLAQVEIGRWHSLLAMTSKRTKAKHYSSSNYNNIPESSKSSNTSDCCGISGNTNNDCYHRDQAECTFCKRKGHIVQVRQRKGRDLQAESLASRLKSADELREATNQNLFKDAGGTDQVIV